jgi:hypothetical protein
MKASKITLHKLQKPIRITFQNLQNPSLSLSLSCANIASHRFSFSAACMTGKTTENAQFSRGSCRVTTCTRSYA